MEEDDDAVWDEEFALTSDFTPNQARNYFREDDLTSIDDAVQAVLAQSGLEAITISGKGRGLKSTKSFKAGDCVLRQNALATCLSTMDASISSRCTFCLQTTGRPMRCSKCKIVHYCCAEHQKKDWPTHSQECSRMARCVAANFTPTTTIILLGRVMDVKQRESTFTPPIGQRFKDLLTSCSNDALHSEQSLISFSQVARAFADYMGPDYSLDMREVMGLLFRFSCNNHTLCDSELRPIGAGVFPLANLANHSCVPNCAQTFRGSTIVIRAIRDIAKGEEIAISYIDLAGPPSLRQKVLKEKYLFQCACDRCSSPDYARRDEEASTITGSEPIVETAQQLIVQAKTKAKDDPVHSLPLLLQALNAAEAAYHTHHIEVHSIRELALKAAIDAQDWPAALPLCSKSVAAYRFYYPPGSPLIGLQLSMLGKLEMYVGQLEAARGHLREALELLGRSHGGDDALVTSLQDMLRECDMALQGFGSFT